MFSSANIPRNISQSTSEKEVRDFFSFWYISAYGPVEFNAYLVPVGKSPRFQLHQVPKALSQPP